MKAILPEEFLSEVDRHLDAVSARVRTTTHVVAAVAYPSMLAVEAAGINPIQHFLFCLRLAALAAQKNGLTEEESLFLFVLALTHDLSTQPKISKSWVKAALDEPSRKRRELQRKMKRCKHLADCGLKQLEVLEASNEILDEPFDAAFMEGQWYANVRHDFPSLGRKVSEEEDPLLYLFVQIDAAWMSQAHIDLMRAGEEVTKENLQAKLKTNVTSIRERMATLYPQKGNRLFPNTHIDQEFMLEINEVAQRAGTTLRNLGLPY